MSSSGTLAGPVSVGAGGTFDVSAAPAGYYTPASGATLTAGGAANAATINGPAGGIVDLSARQVVLNGDGMHPALTVSQSTLILDGSTITVNSTSALDTGTYPLMQANGGGSIVTNGALTVNGTAVVRGYGASLRISGNQLVLDVVRVSAPTITTIGPFAPSQTYGSVVLSATVSPPDATGAVVFFSDGTIVGTNLLDGVTGTAAGPIFPSLLSVGSHQITATYEGDFYYAGSSSAASSNLTVTSRTVTLTGSKTYDKTAVITPATGLGLANNVDGPNLYLTPSNGIAYLAGWNAGLETITSVLVTNGPFNTADFPSIPGNASQIITNASVHYNLPSRVQSKTGTGGPWVGAGSLTLSLGQTPGNGSTLVALIVTDRNGTDLVSGISQTGATWSRVARPQQRLGLRSVNCALVCAQCSERGNQRADIMFQQLGWCGGCGRGRIQQPGGHAAGPDGQ